MKTDIISLWNLSKEQMNNLFAAAAEFKRRRSLGAPDHMLAGKCLGLLFDKPSTRTRISFEAGMIQLGGTPIYISTIDTQLARSEPVADTARVLSRYLDGLVVRTYAQEIVEQMAEAADIPVINALTDMYHPCQILSDILTVMEKKGGYQDLRIAWVGDGNNVAHSWINAAAILGLDLVLACPRGYEPSSAVLKKALQSGRGEIRVTQDPREAVSGADVIYTDVWASMGQEAESQQRKKSFEAYTVNQALVDLAAPDAIVMHCLPAHLGEEITGEVLEGPQSVVWDQAENKLHMHKAILEALLLNWPVYG